MSAKGKPINMTQWSDRDQARFDSRVRWVPATGCMVWTGFTNGDGYGRLRYQRRLVLAHRIAWVRANGQVPDGLELDHLCRVRSCVNPAHLEPVTSLENQARGVGNMSKAECKNGHAFSESNTYMADGFRECRQCRKDGHTSDYAAVRMAFTSLGLTYRQYVEQFGLSRRTALAVLDANNRKASA